MFMFRMKREGDPEKQQANSVFWEHSKEKHQGQLTTEDWDFKALSSHPTPLSRQVTEAVKIAQEGVANILNSKNEFSCNNLPEINIQYGNIRGASGPPAPKRHLVPNLLLHNRLGGDLLPNTAGGEPLAIFLLGWRDVLVAHSLAH